MKTPRYYQTDAHEAIRDAYKKGMKRVLIELATGMGKTVIFVLMAMMAKAKGGKVLILVNRDVLVTQALDELKLNGVFAKREQAEERASLTSEVVVGSIQSMQGKWLQKWPREHFKLVITDEVHGSAAATFRKILDHFESAFHCGVTATAERHDKKGLWRGFEEIVYRMPLNNWTDKDTGEVTIGGIDDGWLVPFDFHDLDCPVTLDLKIASKGVYSETDEVFETAKYLPRLAECAARESVGMKGLFFLANCRQSNGFAELLRAQGLNARHIDSSYMPFQKRKDYDPVTMVPEDRTEELLLWFAIQKEAILCNADLLSVGYNVPDISLIGLFRPIASVPMFKQRLGRGTRPIARVDDWPTAEGRREAIANSPKPVCKVLNVFWENAGHDLASPSALITDDEDEQVALNKKRAPGQQIDFATLQAQLKAKRMADKDEEMRKLAEKLANSQEKMHRAKKGNALYIADILKYRNPMHKPASDAFVRYVRGLGADIPKGSYSAYQIMRVKERLEKLKSA